MSSSQFRRGKRRFDDDESTFLKHDRHRLGLPPADFGSETFGLPEGDRWSVTGFGRHRLEFLVVWCCQHARCAPVPTFRAG